MRYRSYLFAVLAFALLSLAPHCEGHEEGEPIPKEGCVNQTVDPNGGYTCGGAAPAPPPNWPPFDGGNYILHLPDLTAAVHLTPSMRNWDDTWATHYNNAIGWWNSQFQVPIFTDTQESNDARVWILRPESEDEDEVNVLVDGFGYQFEPEPDCFTNLGSGVAWATVNAAEQIFINGHWHRAYQKICVWGDPEPNAIDDLNTEDPAWHYWWLTLVHELGHVLSLPDGVEPTCVMQSGDAMLFPCGDERNWVSAHYGR